MSTIKKFAGDTAIYGLSTILSRMLYFILTPIYVATLPTSTYGVFTKLYSWASLINPLLAFGMETTYFRYLNKHEGSKDKVYSNSFIAIAIMALTFLIGALCFVDNIALWLQKGHGDSYINYTFYIKCFIYILVTDALCVIPFAKVRADGRPMRYSVIKFLNILFVVGLNLFFLFGIPIIIRNHLPGSSWMLQWYTLHWVGYVFLSNLLASLLTLILLLPEIFKLKLQFDFAMFKNMLYYSGPILVANFSFIINENLDKILLDKRLPPAGSDMQLGIYAAACKIAMFLSIFVQAFRLGAEPFFFSHAKNKNAGETYARIMNYFVIVVALIFVGIIANIELLKYFIKGDAQHRQLYWSGLKAVPLLLFGYVSLGIYMNLSVWYKLSDQTKYGLYISGIGAILTVAINWIFIPQYSYMASAWASLIAYATMMMLSYLWGQKNYPIPYNIKKNLAYIIASIVLVFLSFNVFNRNIFAGNALLLLFALITFYVERKQLMLIFKKK